MEERLSRIRPAPNCRKFLINRMGSTGSTWLAKLLNSHPDVFCSHEGIVFRIHPAQNYDESDILKFIESLAAETAHGAYSAIGDIGSVWTGHVAYLPSFTTAILLRHPARLLHTRLRVSPGDRSFTDIPAHSVQVLREVWGLDPTGCEPVDQIFLHDLLTFASQTWAIGRIDFLIRIEDLRRVDYCQRILRALTGVRFPQRLILNGNRSRVNQRTGSSLPVARIVDSFSRRQRDWYGQLLADAGPFFGYNLWNDELSAAPLPGSSPTPGAGVGVRDDRRFCTAAGAFAGLSATGCDSSLAPQSPGYNNA